MVVSALVLPILIVEFRSDVFTATAAVLFWRGWLKLISTAPLVLLSGPAIVALAPVVVSLGYFLYHSLILAAGAGGGIGFDFGRGSIAVDVFAATAAFLAYNRGTIDQLQNAGLDYFDAVASAAHVAVFPAVEDGVQRLLQPFAQVLVWLDSLTFALYLFQRPVIQVLTVYSIGYPNCSQQRLRVIVGTLPVVATVGRLCARQKGAYRRVFLRALPTFTAVEQWRTQSG